mmetsp:Transcript_127436/g.248325  ORF Transcript_127436/g.248325 Transcript_127436/m.248325 type:complete len:501 (+) Transcript_127436:58-1560(+)|eukprot:CAMPEP_0172690842 /NCGR_PEP_ID=MMETSP1074-20121228/24150_1 /TAXON_ID=2916 /ORGANISM="Ceratium fusus, Strain PA161109" /LENGTH=500 /DNA_ID=CAMNT_0013510839 /DNA_START=57 /DNA_END=1559 /DNA_ORIENTATION=-
MGSSASHSYDSGHVQHDLQLLCASKQSRKKGEQQNEETVRKAFVRLRSHLAPAALTAQQRMVAITRVDQQRFATWNPEMCATTDATNRTAAIAQLSDCMRGLLFGAALGDAMGVNTEFLSKQEVQQYYGSTNVSFRPMMQHVFPDDHRVMFCLGDWTDDTDQLILVLQSLLEHEGRFASWEDCCVPHVPALRTLARKLAHWARHGFPELGDESAAGLGQSTKKVLNRQDFKGFVDGEHDACFTAAHDVWVKSGRTLASNGAVMRTAVCGIPGFRRLDFVRASTLCACRVTHADPRCQASCIVVAELVARMLQQSDLIHEGSEALSHEIANLIQASILSGRKVLEEACEQNSIEDGLKLSHLQDFDYYLPQQVLVHGNLDSSIEASVAMLAQLRLDNVQEGIGYAFKCAGASIWALRHLILLMERSASSEPSECSMPVSATLSLLIAEGGDADTNATVAGALLGCYAGFSHGLDRSMLAEMPHAAWLEAWAQKLLVMMGVR